MSSQNFGPVFIIASERSGTNLIRRRLSESQNIYYGPSPVHILKHLFYRVPCYGDLQNDLHFENLIKDCLGLAYQHFSPWDEIIEPKEVIQRYNQFLISFNRTIVGIMHVMYSIYAERKGYSSYICKDNNLFDYLYPITLTIPNAKFIFLYRDPRDFVLSQLKRELQIKNIAYLATLWRQEQIKIIQGINFDEIKRNSYSISYESFIQNEELKLDEIYQFLKIKRVAKKKSLYSNEKTEISEWRNLNKETIKDNYEKFLNELSSKEISLIESIVKSEMKALSYKTVGNGRSWSSVYLKLLIFVGNIKHVLVQRLYGVKATSGEKKRIEYVQSLYDKWK